MKGILVVFGDHALGYRAAPGQVLAWHVSERGTLTIFEHDEPSLSMAPFTPINIGVPVASFPAGHWHSVANMDPKTTREGC